MKRTVSGILFVLLLVSVFMGAFNVQSARANASSQGEALQATDSDWWPMFHHDLNHTGTSTATAPTTNNTLWTYKTGIRVDSSPAVVGGLVYVGSDDHNVYCLSAATGALVWSYETNGSVDSSPAVSGGMLYVGSDDADVYCLNATTGTLVWTYKTGISVWSPPTVADGLVYVGSWDHNVYCLNATTGSLVWKYTTGDVVFSSPTVVGGLVYVGSQDGNFYCINATTGISVWFCNTGGPVSSSAAVVGGLIYVGSEDGFFYCLNASGLVVWVRQIGSMAFSSPAVAGGLVYVGSVNGMVYCLKATTGALAWNYTTGNWVYSSPAAAGGLVYVGSDDGKVYCLDTATGALVWSYKTGAALYSSPAVANGVVYVGSGYPDSRIYAFGPSSNLPLTVSISPKSVTMDAGQLHLFTSNVSGGTSPYAYQWYLNDVAVSAATNSTWKYTTNSTGSYTVHVKVTDNTGASTNSNTVNATVDSALSVTAFPVYDSIELGQLIIPVIFSNVSGGTAPYTYQWYFNSTKISGGTDPTWLFTLLSAGSYNVYVAVTDSVGVTATSNVAQIVVIPALNVTISPPSRFISLGNSVPSTSTVTGGLPTHQYQWYVNGAPVPAATNPTWTFTPTRAGTYNIYLNVTDMWIISASSNIAQITVTAPSVGGVSASVNAFSFSVPWLGTVSLLAAAVLLKGVIAKKKRR